MKTINKSYKNKDHEYERNTERKRNESERHKRQYVHNTQIIEHIPNKPTTSIREKGTDKHENAHT